MSQWGIEKNIGGARFMPLVYTDEPFARGLRYNDVVYICLVDDGESPECAAVIKQRLVEKYLNKPYSLWLNPDTHRAKEKRLNP